MAFLAGFKNDGLREGLGGGKQEEKEEAEFHGWEVQRAKVYFPLKRQKNLPMNTSFMGNCYENKPRVLKIGFGEQGSLQLERMFVTVYFNRSRAVVVERQGAVERFGGSIGCGAGDMYRARSAGNFQ